MATDAGTRPEIRQYIDQLIEYRIVTVGHTTDSRSLDTAAKRNPQGHALAVKPFPAGRYKVLFQKGDAVRAILVQTEDNVGHYVTVIPGKTDIGGYIQIFNVPSLEVPDGCRFTDSELDYLIRKIYAKLRGPVDNDESEKLNRLKDMLLAIQFSAKPGLQGYHRSLLKK